MFSNYFNRTRIAFIVVLSIAASTAAIEGAQGADWVWPTSASNPEVRKSIIETHYTAEETQNIRTVLEFLSTTKRVSNPIWWAPNYKSQGRGFRGLEEFYGSNGYSEEAVSDRTDHVEDIIAKDDRVWVTWMIEGHHTGKLFGFPASGKLVRFRESAVLRFRDGKITEANFRGDDLALYTQAGGKLEFPIGTNSKP